MAKKIRLALLFGGRSAEHEISVLSAASIFHSLDHGRYDVVPVAVGRRGGMWIDREVLPGIQPGSMKLRELVRTNQEEAAIAGPPPRFVTPGGREEPFDVAFPILHGPYGEDGSVQGLLRFVGAPFVGPGVLGSAVAMDKLFAKRLFSEAGVPGARFRGFFSIESSETGFAEAQSTLGLPLFVKPANMGSSVGVSKVEDQTEYNAAVREAFRYDTRILVEEAIVGREVECAVLGNETPEASPVGEIVAKGGFYSYEAKYVQPEAAGLMIPAELDEGTATAVRSVALAAYRALGCEGLARVDMFLKENGEVLVNEVNTLPGFTRISMYPALWAAGGTPYGTLLDRLVGLALGRHERDAALDMAPERR